jgi:hypothetical protein
VRNSADENGNYQANSANNCFRVAPEIFQTGDVSHYRDETSDQKRVYTTARQHIGTDLVMQQVNKEVKQEQRLDTKL